MREKVKGRVQSAKLSVMTRESLKSSSSGVMFTHDYLGKIHRIDGPASGFNVYYVVGWRSDFPHRLMKDKEEYEAWQQKYGQNYKDRDTF